MYKADAEQLAREFNWRQRDIPDADWVDLRMSLDQSFAARDVAGDLMPDVRGMGLRDALYLLENQGLKVSMSGVGLVKSQSLAPGTRVSKGMHIELKLDT
jgi:cell division protein FtsI (penicillin-binding protein 3)